MNYKSIISLASLATLFASADLHAQANPSPFTYGTRFDATGRVTGAIAPDPDGAGPLLYGAIRNTYDAAGRLVLVEKGELSTWQSEEVAPSAWTSFTVLQTVQTAYDVLSRKTKETVSGVESGTMTVKSVIDYSYDTAGRLECTAARMNSAVYGSLPASACTQSTLGPSGPDRIIRNIYDAAGQLLQVRKAVGISLEEGQAIYSYTPNGKKEYVIDANGNRARFVYDGHDRLYQWQFPSTTRPSGYNDSTQANALATAGSANTADYEQYGYDNNGNRTSLRKRDSSTLAYTYDALNRMTHKGGSAIADVDYSYDLLGHQLTATFSTGGAGVTNSYNGFGELKTSMANYQGPALTLTYDYDADGNRCQLTFPDSQVFTYAHDGLDRQAAISQGGTCQSGGGTSLVGFAYDQLGRRSSVGRTAAGSTTYIYDGSSRLQTLNNDLNGTANDQVLTFAYNPASQIVSRAASNDLYAWTGAYNVNRGYATNGLNQYSAAGGDSFTYDLNGNLKTDTASTGTTTFTYDGENRLTGASGLITAGMGYDPMGRMVVVNSPSTWTRLVYDGDDLIAEYNSSGTLLRRYLHGPGEDEPLVQYEGADLSIKRLLHADQQGSVIAITDGAGSSLSTNRYDEYGVPQNTNSGRFQYTGQQWIPEVGMSYYKARFYSPTLGRFMQTDPIGYDGGITLYEYAESDPVDNVDSGGEVVTYSRHGYDVYIHWNIAYYGAANTVANERRFSQGIVSAWNGLHGKYNVHASVSTFTFKSGTQPSIANIAGHPELNFVEIPAFTARATTSGDRFGKWGANRPGWTAAHEAGHLASLEDQYDGSGAHAGYEHDIMGTSMQPVTGRTVTDLIRVQEGGRPDSGGHEPSDWSVDGTTFIGTRAQGSRICAPSDDHSC